MAPAWDKEKIWVQTGIELMTFCTQVRCSNHWAKKDACILCTARISNVETVMCVINKERWWILSSVKKWENNDVINMSRAWDKEKIQVPIRNWTYNRSTNSTFLSCKERLFTHRERIATSWSSFHQDRGRAACFWSSCTGLNYITEYCIN